MKRGVGSILALLLAAGTAPGDDAAVMKALKATGWAVPELGMKLRLIPAGTFVMGSGAGEVGRREDETPRTVTISRPFYMGVYEVTQREYYKLMLPADFDYEGWKFKRGPIHLGTAFCWRYGGSGLIFNTGAVGGELTDDHPMECVTWAKAMEFCRKLTERERAAGRLPKGHVYRLPTEAQWEYACRAGSAGPYNVEGDFTKLSFMKSIAFLRTHNWTRFGTAPVGGGRKPNAWGLYDMHGNVYEWCLDWYGPYAKGKAADPAGAAEGTEKVARGGCFAGLAGKAGTAEVLAKTVHPFLRSASRYRFPPDANYYAILGFRVVLAPAMPGRAP
jgi:formylglycine-generating enzyme required for sulfatase activity